MAGTIITNANFNNAQEYTAKNRGAAWYNVAQSRWDAILPDSTSDQFLMKDVDGAQTFISAPELDDRDTGRPDVIWDESANKLYVLSSHGTNTEFFRLGYNSGTDVYSLEVGTERNGITVTDIDRADITRPSALTKLPNGKLVAVANEDGIFMNHSTDDGATWQGPALNLDSGFRAGHVCIGYWNDGADNRVGVFGSEDDDNASAIWKFWHAKEGDDLSLAGSWTAETQGGTMPAFTGGEEADDHCHMVVHNNIIYVTVKIGTPGTNDDNITVLKRTASGTWTRHTVQVFTAANERTRPAAAIDTTNSAIYVAYTDAGGGTNDVMYRRADLSDLDTWDAEVDLFDGANTFNQVCMPRETVTGATDLLVTAADETAGDLYYNLITLASAGGGAARRRVGIGAGLAMRR